MKLYLTEDTNLRNSGFSDASHALQAPRHRWYPVKEAFSPDLVTYACDQVGLDQSGTLFDPFSGSGTVCVAAAQSQYRAKAVEVNPFLAFLGRTKLSQCSKYDLWKLYDKVRKAADSDEQHALESYSTFSSKGGKAKWLFPLKPLRAGLAGLNHLPLSSDAEVSLLRLALIGAVMDCCNAYKDGKCLRYKSKWFDKESTRSDFFDFFDHRVRTITEDLEHDPLVKADSSIFEGDVRSPSWQSETDCFDLTLTSPPYLNSFDYSDVYRPELFVGGFVQTNDDLMRLRLRTLRSHVQAKWPEPSSNKFGLVFERAFISLVERAESLWDKRIPSMVRAYFEDMLSLMRDIRGKSKTDSHIWIVVSTSAYAGVEIPVDLILAELAPQSGWILDKVSVVRQLRSSSQHSSRESTDDSAPVQLRESVVVLKADPRWKLGHPAIHVATS